MIAKSAIAVTTMLCSRKRGEAIHLLTVMVVMMSDGGDARGGGVLVVGGGGRRGWHIAGCRETRGHCELVCELSLQTCLSCKVSIVTTCYTRHS